MTSKGKLIVVQEEYYILPPSKPSPNPNVSKMPPHSDNGDKVAKWSAIFLIGLLALFFAFGFGFEFGQKTRPVAAQRNQAPLAPPPPAPEDAPVPIAPGAPDDLPIARSPSATEEPPPIPDGDNQPGFQAALAAWREKHGDGPVPAPNVTRNEDGSLTIEPWGQPEGEIQTSYYRTFRDAHWAAYHDVRNGGFCTSFYTTLDDGSYGYRPIPNQKNQVVILKPNG